LCCNQTWRVAQPCDRWDPIWHGHGSRQHPGHRCPSLPGTADSYVLVWGSSKHRVQVALLQGRCVLYAAGVYVYASTGVCWHMRWDVQQHLCVCLCVCVCVCVRLYCVLCHVIVVAAVADSFGFGGTSRPQIRIRDEGPGVRVRVSCPVKRGSRASTRFGFCTGTRFLPLCLVSRECIPSDW